MQIYAAFLNRYDVALFERKDEAINCAGEYWSITTDDDLPVQVLYYSDTLYDDLRHCQDAADLNQPWIAHAGQLIWKNGIPVQEDKPIDRIYSAAILPVATTRQLVYPGRKTKR